MTARPLLRVDSASLYFRAYFGIPESSATAPDGTPVNAVRGFLDMVATLVRTRRPGRLICALDADWRPADGITEVVPEGLNRQVPIIEAVLAATGIVAVGAPGYEADDVIGTLAAREPGPVEVASGDRDLFQVVDDARGVRVLYCGRGVAKLQVCDDSAIRARYGIPAAGYADFAGLRGKLAEARDYLAKAPEVVRVATDIPLPPLDGALPATPADTERVMDLAERWNIAGPLRRFVDAVTQ